MFRWPAGELNGTFEFRWVLFTVGEIVRPGSEEEFESFVRARYAALVRFAWFLTGNWATAEDLVQTALLKVWGRWGRLREVGSAEAYVQRVLVTTRSHWWRRRSHGEIPTEWPPDRGGDDAFTVVDDRDVLVRVLRRLSHRQRCVLALRYYEGLSEAEVAGVLGCAVGTVKSSAARALDRLSESGLLPPDEAKGA